MTIKITIEGTRPLIMQSDRLVDALDPLAQELKRAAKSKDKNSEKGQQEIARIEFMGCLYQDENGVVGIPQDNLLRMLRDGGAKERMGKEAQSQLTILDEFHPLQYAGPKTAEKLLADPAHVFRKSVVVGRARVMRTRPRFPAGWKLSFQVLIGGNATLKVEDVRRFIDSAGPLGIGTFRPRYGGFKVIDFK